MIRILLPSLAIFTALAALSPEPPRRPVVQDERVATVLDRQGTALVRPAGRRRWTPLAPRSVLLPGDRVKTEARGANALELSLERGGTVVLGPGALIELQEGRALNVLRGDVEVKAGGGGAIGVTGPGGYRGSADPALILRAGEGTEVLERAPRWLTGYRSSTTDEWMGSLLAKVDGRDVPLTVGYHKVHVTIRDQIAETVVEQSFVNTTDATLEGVFHFPLPADASISGFGMWVHGELVEADIVERQRARAIYEEILRRKKDPGLLEWEGGNVFKASVYPIFPHSEKRVRIRYTQVLPLEGDVVRYRYALRSELLQRNPVRDLRIHVDVASAAPLAKAQSSTHELALEQTEHTVSADFEAQEYRPLRDFELSFELARTEPLTVVTHERADDGYLMILVTPPDQQGGGWQRDLMPEGDPVRLVLLADTSGSMDPKSRAAQHGFVEALLSMLGPDDRFRLLTCDVNARWFRNEDLVASDANRDAALEFLRARDSLGWTDLDAAFGAVGAVASAGTAVVYVGDGIGTTGDADPNGLARRLTRLDADGATFHAVSTSTTYEKAVLDAIASLGGGSVRETGDDPAAAAYRLLAEAAQPAVKGVQVSFEGLQTARVYPQTLPNLPLGRQQVVLARYLPGNETLVGRAVATGMLDGESRRYVTDVTIRAGETGNSFLPRLWARSHIDALLAAGGNQEEVIDYSERFGILTPFTSFLVLESDADREEFGVRRQVAMRDGEKFFAKGRDQAATETLRQAMARAKSWRLDLRRRLMREIATLGKELYGWNVAVGDQLLAVDRLAVDYRYLGAANEVPRRSELPSEEVSDEQEQDLLQDFDLEMEAGEERKDEAAEPAESPSTLALDDAVLGNRRRAANRPVPASKAGLLGRGYYQPSQPRVDFGFPSLTPAAVEPPARPDPKWDPQVLTLLRSLDGREDLAEVALLLRVIAVRHHAANGLVSPQEGTEIVWNAGDWVQRQQSVLHGTGLEWVAGDQRGVLLEHLGLGRQRQTAASDRRFPLHQAHLGTYDWVRSYRAWSARLSRTEGNTVTVVLTAPRPSHQSVELVIDRESRFLLEQRTFDRGRLRSRLVMQGRMVAAGRTWARTAQRYDEDGHLVWSRDLLVQELEDADAATRVADRLAVRETAILLPAEETELDVARENAHAGRATFADHFVLVQFETARQRWDAAFRHWASARALVAGKPGAGWIELQLLVLGRRGTELLEHARAMAGNAAEMAQAERLHAQAAQVVGAGEQLDLLERTKHAYGPADQLQDARRRVHTRRRAQLLHQLDRHDEALTTWVRLAAAEPRDAQAVLDLARNLGQASRHKQAVAVVREALSRAGTWTPHERNSMFQVLTDELWTVRRLAELEGETARWVAEEPQDTTAYTRHLTVLLFRNQAERADRWVDAVREGSLQPAAEPAQRAKIQAALMFVMGNGWNYYVYDFSREQAELAAAWVRALARVDEGGFVLASQVLNDWRFRRTDAHARLLAELRDELLAGGAIAEMHPERLQGYVRAIAWQHDECPREQWLGAVEALERRHLSADDDYETQIAGRLVLQLCDARLEGDRARNLLRGWVRRADEEQRHALARDLIERLGQADWSAEIEQEMFSLLPTLADPWATEDARVHVASGSARFVADTLLEMRQKALLGPPAELEKLTRVERRQRQKDARRQAIEGLATVLAQAAVAESLPAWLSPWLAIEAQSLDVRRAAADGGDALANSVRVAKDLMAQAIAADGDPLWRALRERCSLVMAYAAISSKAPEGLADEILAFYETGRVAHGGALDWQYQTFRLLLVLDRTEQLATTLKGWIVPARLDRPWRLTLAFLHAEENRLPDAVEVLERLLRDDELEPRHYASLADWYLVLGEDVRREQALTARYDAMDLNELYQLVNRERRSVRAGADGVPATFDPEVLRAMTALLRKAPQPDNYIWNIRTLYEATKDFRTLSPMIAGVPGHSAEAAYGFLLAAIGVLDNVHEEATLDDLAEHVAATLGAHDAAPDRRALHLLRALVHRRASMVREGGAAHHPAMQAALEQALSGAVTDVEVVPLAQLLSRLGTLPTGAARDLVLDELEELFSSREPGSVERLAVAVARSEALFNNNRGERGVDSLLAALAEHGRARGGSLPPSANNAVDTLIRLGTAHKQFAVVERFLLEERERQPAISTTRHWYLQRVYALYATCLDQGGGVSLGTGGELYERARTDLERWIAEVDRSWVPELVRVHCDLHQAAHKRRVGRRVGRDLRGFAEGLMLELLPDLPLEHHNVVERVAETLAVVATKRDGLRVLVQRTLTEPSWHERVGRDGWRQFHWEMARMYKGIDLGDVEAGLEKIVLTALERNLRELSDTGQQFYNRNNQYFWGDKRGEFLTLVRRVVETTPDQPAVQLFAARYLWNGLYEKREAVDVLAAADTRAMLRTDGRWQLAQWLRDLRRHAEALPHLEQLIAGNQDVLDYRAAMVHSLHEVGRDDDALALVEGTEKRWTDQDRWNENAQAALAQACLDSGFDAHAERLFLLAIRNRERGRTLTRQGDQRLSKLYRQLARAQAGLEKYDEAVESAGAAIVCCGERQDHRSEAITALQHVLEQIADLDAFVARRDAQVAESGLDSPVVRRGLGAAYTERGHYEKALRQYSLARELQPEDVDTVQRMVALHDRLGRTRQACELLMEALAQSPYDLSLPHSLAERLQALGESERAERAWTQLVENAPQDAESHRLLAQARERQKRHADAVVQWQQVVRIRSLEPEGWLDLARAQIAAGQRDAARETLRKVLDKQWEPRHGNVKELAAEILRRAG